MTNWRITNEHHLLHILGVSKAKLHKLLDYIDTQYYSFPKKEIKADGKIKVRVITPPTILLKFVQDRIRTRILDKIPLPNYMQGARKGKDNLSNGSMHRGKKQHFCLDIKNFFPSISNARINAMFLSNGFHPHIASILTRLVTHKGHLPQGAPTSPLVANLVAYKDICKPIEEIIISNSITFTTFVDDINFSSQKDFKHISIVIIQAIIQSGFKINKSKTFYKLGDVEMTGAIVGNNVLKVMQKHKEKLDDPGLKESSKKGLENYVRRLKSNNKT